MMLGSRREGSSDVEKDYLLRQLKQLLEALVKKIFQEELPPAQSQEDLRSICSELMDLDYDQLSRLNVPSMVMLLRTPERIEAFALIMEVEAQQLRAKGDVAAALTLEDRAQTLRVTPVRTERR